MQTIIRQGIDTINRWASTYPFALGLFLLLIIYFGAGIGHYPLFDVDEPRYAETAREMLIPPCDWLAPHFNFELRFDKPPLFYWLIALSYKVFGVTVGSARMVSVVSAAFTGTMVYCMARRFWSISAGLLAVGIFMTMPQVFGLSRWAVTDMTLTMTMTGAWVGLMLGWLSDRRWFLVAGFMAGLGLLTKGPIAVALPGITLLLSLWAWSQLGLTSESSQPHKWRVLGWSLLKSPWLWSGLGLALCMALPWFIAMGERFPDEFGAKLYLHNITRFTSTVSGHKGAWWYYIPVLLLGAAPWTFLIPLMGTVIVQELRALVSGQWKAWPQHQAPEKASWLYVLMWFVVVVVFFSLSKTKLLTYVLPAFPAMALLGGWTIVTWARRMENMNGQAPHAQQWLMRLMASIATMTMLIWVFSLMPMFKAMLPVTLMKHLSPTFMSSALFLLMLTMVAGSFVLYRSASVIRSMGIVILGLTLVYTYTGWAIVPPVGRWVQHDLHQCATIALRDKATLATYQTKKPSLVYTTQAQVYYVLSYKEAPTDTKRVLQHLYDKRRPLYLVMKTLVRHELDGVYTMTERYHGRQFSLMQVDISPSQRIPHLPESELPDYTHQ